MAANHDAANSEHPTVQGSFKFVDAQKLWERAEGVEVADGQCQRIPRVLP